jgi:hypothetical protein
MASEAPEMSGNDDDLEFLRRLTGDGPETLRWRLLRRSGRVLLAMRDTPQGIRAGTGLYRPQRSMAKRVCRLLDRWPLLRLLLPTVRLGVAPGGPLHTCLGPGGPGAAAILLGNPVQKERRAVALTSGPAPLVVKLGWGAAAVAAIHREADFLQNHRHNRVEIPAVRSRAGDADWAAFSTDFLPPGSADGSLAELAAILDGWWCGEPVPLRTLPGWERLSDPVNGLPRGILSLLENLPLRPAMVHGDLAPWNLLRNNRGEPVAIDWENARIQDVPCWDAVHFIFQKLVLVDRTPVGELLPRIHASLATDGMKGLLERAGWAGIETLLIITYLVGMAVEKSVVSQVLEIWKKGGMPCGS